MNEYGTFSSLVDAAMRRTGRPGMSMDVTIYARAAIRECQRLVRSSNDLQEAEWVVDASPYISQKPANFREIVYAELPGRLTSHGVPVEVVQVQPGRKQANFGAYYYVAGNSLAFSSVEYGALINVAYLTWTQALAYHALETDRPARYDVDTDTWLYASATTPEEEEAARALTQNWLLESWFELLLQGVCAKIWTGLADDRARAAYAGYKQLQNDLTLSDVGAV